MADYAPPQSPDLLDEEESSVNTKGREHPCQSDFSPTGVVREQREVVDQVCHHICSWQARIEENEP